MRILTLVAGEDALPEVRALAHEISEFNRGIDFRLRFLHIEIEISFAGSSAVAEQLDQELGKRHVLAASGPLEATASLALLLDRERPALLLIAGGGPLCDAGVAAAAVVGTKLALFGAGRGAVGDGLDLGADPRLAIEKMTGVAREIG